MLGLLLMSRALDDDDEQPTKLPNSSVSTKVAHDVQIRRCTGIYTSSVVKNEHNRESALYACAQRRCIHTLLQLFRDAIINDVALYISSSVAIA
uniref:Uncharacterized protein n=1 Tax=Trichogramma kaykai TaxID=54128 RepID=A0ABD2VUD1_9HYME